MIWFYHTMHFIFCGVTKINRGLVSWRAIFFVVTDRGITIYPEMYKIRYSKSIALDKVYSENYAHGSSLFRFGTCQFYSYPSGPLFTKRQDVSPSISWSLEAARFDVIMIILFWNLTGISAVLLLRCLSISRTIGKVWTRISRLRVFTRSCGRMSHRIVNGGPRVTSALIAVPVKPLWGI